MNNEPIIAIDGPSGAGKSTLSRRLARALSYTYIDTGAMYRSVALAAQRARIDPDDDSSLAELCDTIRIEFVRGGESDRVLLDGEDVSSEIRTPENSLLTSRISSRLPVREAMVRLQREMGARGAVVLEGRDIGTVVFPEADVKFFLSASARERGRRRYEELKAKGLEVDLDQTIAEVEARDAADSAREHAPLLMAADAFDIDTTQKNIEEVLEEMLHVVEAKRLSAAQFKRNGP